MTIQEAIQIERAKYKTNPTEDQCVAICNDAAYACRNQPERWGISGKSGGSHGVRSDGKLCAVDIIQNGVTLEIFDVLVAAGFDPATGTNGPATPSWQPKGVLNDPQRPYVAPIPPAGGPPPVDPPPVDPPPVDPELPPYATAAALEKHDKEIKAALGGMVTALKPVLQQAVAGLSFVGEFRIFGQRVTFTLTPKVQA